MGLLQLQIKAVEAMALLLQEMGLLLPQTRAVAVVVRLVAVQETAVQVDQEL